MKTVKYGKVHKAIMLKCGKTLIDVQSMDTANQEIFIEKELTPFLNSEIYATAEAADQLVDMIRYWEVGQTKESYV
jgi:hypothetical protein